MSLLFLQRPRTAKCSVTTSVHSAANHLKKQVNIETGRGKKGTSGGGKKEKKVVLAEV